MNTSKISIALFLTTLLSSPTWGAAGFHGGVNFMNASVSGSNSDTGFLVGLHGDHVLISEFLSIRPEINLNRVGAENSAFGGFGTKRFTYAEFALLLKLSLYTKAIEIFGLAGPKIALLVNTTTEVAGVTIQSSDRTSYEGGFYLGGGLGIIPRGATRFHVIGRFVFGLTDIDTSGTEWKSNGFQLLASLSF